jgi:hypothetical protein
MVTNLAGGATRETYAKSDSVKLKSTQAAGRLGLCEHSIFDPGGLARLAAPVSVRHLL